MELLVFLGIGIKDLLNPQFYIEHGGLWMVLFIVFAETGLFAGFFLPGDALLFVTGIFSDKIVSAALLPTGNQWADLSILWAHRAVDGHRVVGRIAPWPCLDDHHALASAGQRDRGGRPARATADHDVVGVEREVLAARAKRDVGHDVRNVPGSGSYGESANFARTAGSAPQHIPADRRTRYTA